jgi:hypothetical protein
VQEDAEWYDPMTLKGSEGPCFVCKRPTDRIDLSFEAPYCGSPECEQQIRLDLESGLWG